MWTLRKNKTARKDADETARDLLAGNRLVTMALLAQNWK